MKRRTRDLLVVGFSLISICGFCIGEATGEAKKPACPRVLIDGHHGLALDWDGIVITPERETIDSFHYGPGTPRCVYYHEYQDEQRRTAIHLLELRLRDGALFHMSKLPTTSVGLGAKTKAGE
jgi:hypothetical protein